MVNLVLYYSGGFGSDPIYVEDSPRRAWGLETTKNVMLNSYDLSEGVRVRHFVSLGRRVPAKLPGHFSRSLLL